MIYEERIEKLANDYLNDHKESNIEMIKEFMKEKKQHIANNSNMNDKQFYDELDQDLFEKCNELTGNKSDIKSKDEKPKANKKETKKDLILFDEVRMALTKIKTIPDAKKVIDVAEMIKDYVKRQKNSLEIQNDAAEIGIRARIRGGELLKETELHKGVQMKGSKVENDVQISVFEQNDCRPRLKDLDLNKTQSSNWKCLANWDEKEREKYFKKTKSLGKEITNKEAIRLARRKIPSIKEGKFSIIYVDFTKSKPNIEDIKVLDIPSAEKAILFLRTTQPMVKQAFEIMSIWGFQYRAGVIWRNRKPITGKYCIYKHDQLLIGTKGKNFADSEDVPGSIHEKKEEIYSMIEKMYPNKEYIELFSQKPHKGWISG